MDRFRLRQTFRGAVAVRSSDTYGDIPPNSRALRLSMRLDGRMLAAHVPFCIVAGTSATAA
jgi:hypothetical protein